MNTFLSLLAAAVFAFAVLFGGEPLSTPRTQHMPAQQQEVAGANTELAYAKPKKQRPFSNKHQAKPLKKKKTPNDDFQDLNN